MDLSFALPTPFLFVLVCTFRYCSNCGRLYSLKLVYISICKQWVCMAVVVIIFVLILINRGFFYLFCMIDRKAGASQL